MLLLQNIPYYCETDPFPWQSCRQDKLGCMSPILTFSPCSESELQHRGRVGSLCEEDVVAVPCRSSSLVPTTGAEAEVDVQAEDRSICFSCCYKTSQTKLQSLCSAASYLAASKISTALHSGIKTKKTHKTAQDCSPHTAPPSPQLASLLQAVAELVLLNDIRL